MVFIRWLGQLVRRLVHAGDRACAGLAICAHAWLDPAACALLVYIKATFGLLYRPAAREKGCRQVPLGAKWCRFEVVEKRG